MIQHMLRSKYHIKFKRKELNDKIERIRNINLPKNTMQFTSLPLN